MLSLQGPRRPCPKDAPADPSHSGRHQRCRMSTMPNVDGPMRIANHSAVSGSDRTIGKLSRRKTSTSFSFPDFASNPDVQSDCNHLISCFLRCSTPELHLRESEKSPALPDRRSTIPALFWLKLLRPGSAPRRRTGRSPFAGPTTNTRISHNFVSSRSKCAERARRRPRGHSACCPFVCSIIPCR
jgi:hypothetical protein